MRQITTLLAYSAFKNTSVRLSGAVLGANRISICHQRCAFRRQHGLWPVFDAGREPAHDHLSARCTVGLLGICATCGGLRHLHRSSGDIFGGRICPWLRVRRRWAHQVKSLLRRSTQRGHRSWTTPSRSVIRHQTQPSDRRCTQHGTRLGMAPNLRIRPRGSPGSRGTARA
jgi:hypothetical protein